MKPILARHREIAVVTQDAHIKALSLGVPSGFGEAVVYIVGAWACRPFKLVVNSQSLQCFKQLLTPYFILFSYMYLSLCRQVPA